MQSEMKIARHALHSLLNRLRTLAISVCKLSGDIIPGDHIWLYTDCVVRRWLQCHMRSREQLLAYCRNPVNGSFHKLRKVDVV